MATRSRHRTGRRVLRVAAGGLAVGGMVAGVGVAGAAQQAAPATVSVTSTAYTPPAVSVNTGEKVTWQINDELPHNVEGVEGPDAGWAAGAYQSPIVANGVAEYTFTQPGTYTYLCTVHPTQMTGTVTVSGPPVTPTPTPPGGTPTPTPTPPPPAPTATPGPSGTPPAPSGTTPAPGSAPRDGAAPAISGLSVKAIRRGARITLTLTETSTVTLRFKQRKSGKVVRTARLQVRSGKRILTVRGGGLRQGRYVVELEARDSGGNVGAMQRASLRIKKARG
jgi:plastocyanin